MIVVGLWASGRASEWAGGHTSGRVGARLILTVRVTSAGRHYNTYIARTGGTVIGRQGLLLTVRVAAWACYACYAMLQRLCNTYYCIKQKQKPIRINELERERDKIFVCFVGCYVVTGFSEREVGISVFGRYYYYFYRVVVVWVFGPPSFWLFETLYTRNPTISSTPSLLKFYVHSFCNSL